MTKWLFSISFLFCALSITGNVSAQDPDVQTTKAIQAKEFLPLFDEGLFDLALSGLSSIDFKKVHTELLALQPELLVYQKQQQAFYWYNLAVCSRELALPSDQVLPYIEKALSFSSYLDQQHHFKILDKAIALAAAYQHYELLITYIEQLRQLAKDQLDPATLRLPAEYENLEARAYYQTGQLAKAELYLTQLMDEAGKNHNPQNVNWFTLLGDIYAKNKDRAKQIAILRKQLELFPSANREQYLSSMLESRANQD